MDPGSLPQVALWSGIIRDAVAVVSLVFAVWSYRRTAKSQAHSAQAQVQLSALSTLQHYLDMAVANPELATRDESQPVDASYGWFAAQALNTAQTLWTQVGEHEDWQRAINAIVRHHQSYLRSGAFTCNDFTPQFIDYLRGRVPDLRCADG